MAAVHYCPELYDALRKAGVDHEVADKAAEAVVDHKSLRLLEAERSAARWTGILRTLTWGMGGLAVIFWVSVLAHWFLEQGG